MSSKSVKALLELCRVSNLPTVWTNVLAAIILTGTSFSLSYFLLLSLSMSLFYSGGMCMNDICDAETDRKNRPSRPIPSGRILLRNAYRATAVQFLMALSLLLFFPYRKAFSAGLFLLLAIVMYDKFHKDHPWSVLIMAACRLMVFAVSSIAVAGTVESAAAVGGLLQFAYVLIISITARFENKSGQFSFPVIPYMIAGISLLDGVMMAFFASTGWIAVGFGGFFLTLMAQKYVRGN